jgi:hypothetical protein
MMGALHFAERSAAGVLINPQPGRREWEMCCQHISSEVWTILEAAADWQSLAHTVHVGSFDGLLGLCVCSRLCRVHIQARSQW